MIKIFKKGLAYFKAQSKPVQILFFIVIISLIFLLFNKINEGRTEKKVETFKVSENKKEKVLKKVAKDPSKYSNAPKDTLEGQAVKDVYFSMAAENLDKEYKRPNDFIVDYLKKGDWENVYLSAGETKYVFQNMFADTIEAKTRFDIEKATLYVAKNLTEKETLLAQHIYNQSQLSGKNIKFSIEVV